MDVQRAAELGPTATNSSPNNPTAKTRGRICQSSGPQCFQFMTRQTVICRSPEALLTEVPEALRLLAYIARASIIKAGAH